MSWLGFNTAVSGLIGSQRKLYTTSHNIANANTPGYSKQVARQSASTPHYMSSVGYIGTGTQINLVERIRNNYLDNKYRSESSPLGEWGIKKDALTQIEHIFGEGEDHGLSVNINDFFKTLEKLGTNPSESSHRIAFRESAVSFTKQLNELAQKLYKEQKDLNIEIGGKIKKVNEIGEQIKNINDQIFRLEIDGHPANDLRDQRDLLVDELSKIVDIKTYEENGKFIVTVGGSTLVEHNSARKLKYPPETVPSSIDPSIDLYKVQWENGQDVFLKSGDLKGLLEVRDGDGKNGKYNGVPYYLGRLDEFAKVFAEQMNKIHEQGYTLGNPPENGIKLFENSNGSEIRADNIMVSKKIMEDQKNIATADETNGVENKGIVEELLKLRHKKDFFSGPDVTSGGTPEDYITSIISVLGVDSQHTQRMADKQQMIVKNVMQKRDSISQVDPDEEMSDMVRFTQAYNASARMITTFDHIFDVTINRLGLVGR
ncbi:flagellar hook-associated protein 1 [Gottschalkia purinilytica]|uniref:Flagellar hook-associated protein 1 n=1 Tax=Gottschalkia purinilytica TaxID=1503 RepID=A0A0L0WDV2_GOTPU|nr:flagellar hook-associated protein FlgK [Gottschalkia purinilytica]KNF09657.1 flagellar hook-associated protein 1 [Gottschalkia purinilytica]